MFGDIFKNIEENLTESNIQNWNQLTKTIFVEIYFNGDLEKAIKYMNNLRATFDTEENFLEELSNLYNGKLFIFISGEKDSLTTFKGMVKLVRKFINNRDELITNQNNLDLFLKKRRFAFDKHKELVFKCMNETIGNNLKGISKTVLEQKLFYTTKSEIANEFGIDKRTLNKWLKYYFKDKFHGRKKIYLEEYHEIFKKFFLSEGEEFDLLEYHSKYEKRMKKGMNFKKSEIAFLVESDLKTMKENLKNQKYYEYLDVYPYSIAVLFINKMGSEVTF